MGGVGRRISKGRCRVVGVEGGEEGEGLVGTGAGWAGAAWWRAGALAAVCVPVCTCACAYMWHARRPCNLMMCCWRCCCPHLSTHTVMHDSQLVNLLEGIAPGVSPQVSAWLSQQRLTILQRWVVSKLGCLVLARQTCVVKGHAGSWCHSHTASSCAYGGRTPLMMQMHASHDSSRQLVHRTHRHAIIPASQPRVNHTQPHLALKC